MFIRSDAYIEKASRLKEGEVEVVVSTDALDAYGERINIDGIDYKDYKKNPVVLWGHDGFNLPIGKAVRLWKEEGKLKAKVLFYLKDEFAKKVYDYIVDGFLNAVSIGGMVEEWGKDGVTISRMVMKEFSVVSIPANPEALVTQKSLSSDQENELKGLANMYARKMLGQNKNINEEVKTLESLVATLKEVSTFAETHADEADETSLRVVLKQVQAVDKQAEKISKSIKVQLKGTN